MGFMVGAAQAEIRYPQEMFPTENFVGSHDPIYARAIVMEQSITMAVVSLELPSVRPYSLLDELRGRMAEKFHLAYENLWICTTHDLAAPHVPSGTEQPEKHAIHMAAVENAVTAALSEAIQNKKEAKFGCAFAQADVNSGRDVLTKDGWWLGVNRAQPSDKLLSVIRFETAGSREPIALIYHYAVKNAAVEAAVFADGTRLVTSDLTGFASCVAEARFGVPAIFLMGAAGDQVPRRKGEYIKVREDGSYTAYKDAEEGFRARAELGQALGDALIRAAEGLVCGESSFSLRHLSYLLPGQAGYSGGKPYRPMKEYTFVPAADEPLEVDLLRLGNIALFGAKPEATARVGLLLREGVDGCVPLLAAMVNGGKDYIADESAYERLTFAGTHSVFARGAAEKLVGLLKKELL